MKANDGIGVAFVKLPSARLQCTYGSIGSTPPLDCSARKDPAHLTGCCAESVASSKSRAAAASRDRPPPVPAPHLALPSVTFTLFWRTARHLHPTEPHLCGTCMVGELSSPVHNYCDIKGRGHRFCMLSCPCAEVPCGTEGWDLQCTWCWHPARSAQETEGLRRPGQQ